MKELNPVMFTKENTEVTKDYRAVVENDDPKASSVQVSVNELPPEKSQLESKNSEEESKESEESTTHLVPPSQLKSSLQESSENPVSAEKVEKKAT